MISTWSCLVARGNLPLFWWWWNNYCFSSIGSPNLRSGVFFFCFFASLAREGKKNNAWYIYLTSSQPPPNLHNLTSAWPVMLLANKRLPYGNQILARIMSLLKSILGKRKFLNTSMFRWRFLIKNFLMKYCSLKLPYLYLTATDDKEFTC